MGTQKFQSQPFVRTTILQQGRFLISTSELGFLAKDCLLQEEGT